MLLRTYPLIVHPAYLDHVEEQFRENPFRPDRLTAANTSPRLDDAYDIGAYLGIGNELIVSMLSDAKRHYRAFPVTKRSGGIRLIRAPRTYLKVIQWWILDTLLVKVRPHDCAFGFVKGRSFIDNAMQHCGARHIVNVDIKDFFPSLKIDGVSAVFSGLGYNLKVSAQLARLTTFSGELPQGAPTSPALANAMFHPLDVKIDSHCRDFGIRYTRYADDLTFSSSEKIPAHVIQHVEDTLRASGLFLNGEKTRYMGLNDTKEVTGLVIGRDGVRLARDFLNATRGWLHKLKLAPAANWTQLERVVGTRNLIAQVGGAGSARMVTLADETISALQAARAAWLISLAD